jgi:hypothetical protein
LDEVIEDVFRIEGQKVIYQYTSLEAVGSILAVQEFWSTAHDGMNDVAELVSADEVIKQVAEELLQESTGRVEFLLRQFRDGFAPLHIQNMADVYLSCFSEARDDSHLWCADYGRRGTGVCLGVRILDERPPTPRDRRRSALLRVSYSEEAWRVSVRQGFEKVCAAFEEEGLVTRRAVIGAISALHRVSAFAAVTAKKPSWSAEREFRVVTFVPKGLPPLPRERTYQGKRIRYLSNKVRADGKLISPHEIIIGPNQDPSTARPFLMQALARAGYEEGDPEFPTISISACQPCEPEGAGV